MINDAHTDAELVQRFKRGDQAAFEQLVQRHQDRIYRLALVLLDDQQQAGDAAQDVMLRAYQGLARFRFQAAPFTWLFRTTKNVCREYNRRRGFTTLAREPADGAVSAAAQWDESRCRETIRELVMTLPARQRDVVMLRYFEELSTADTARAMGCRPGTVKALLHKAVQRLRASSTAGALGDTLADELGEER